MELQIQDLISTIRKEGIENANMQAEQILADARAKADELLKNARAEAAKTKEDAARDIESLKSSAVVSVQQAQRDAVLSFKKEIQSQFESILTADIKKAVSDESLGKLIAAVIRDEDVEQYAVEVASVTEGLKGQLADEIKKGLEIRPVKDVQAGFRLASKDGSGYFDCTDEEITKMLMPFFSELSI